MLDWPVLVFTGLALLATVATAFLVHDPHPELRALPEASRFVRTGLWLRFQELRGREVGVVDQLHRRIGPMIRVSRNAVSVATDSPQLRSIHSRTSFARRSAQYEELLITSRPPIFGLRDAREHAARRAGFGKAYTRNKETSQKAIDLLTHNISIANGQTVDALDLFWEPVMLANQELLFGASAETQPATSYDELRTRRRGECVGHGSPVETLRLISLLPSWLSKRLRSRTTRTQGALWVDAGCAAAAESTDSNNACARMQKHFRSAMEEQVERSSLSSKEECVVRDQVRNEMIDQLTGGMDFPLAALTCAVHMLSGKDQNHWQDRMSESGDAVVTAVLNEVLRLFPPAAGSQPRELLQPVAVPLGSGAIELQRGAIVHAQPQTLHRNPSIFPDPDNFQPERWMSGQARSSDLWAFGKGPTHCIAQEYAMRSMKAMLTAACEMARFETAEETGTSGLIPSQGLLLSPNGIKVRVALR